MFVRGTAAEPRRLGREPDRGSRRRRTRTIWAARTSGGGAWKLGEGTTPALSPDGTTVAYAKDGQIYAYEVRLKPDTTGDSAAKPA